MLYLCYIRVFNKSLPAFVSSSLLQFQKYFLLQPSKDHYKIIKEFLSVKPIIVKNRNFNKNSDIITICVVRNDIKRIKQFLLHYRSLGITRFSFLDDQSTDGTKELLLQQDDVEIFECRQRYITARRIAWIQHLLLYYGFNRWFIVVDSDELLVYDNYENNKIQVLIKYLEKKNFTGCSAMMLDMYPRSSDAIKELQENPYAGVDYFDTSGYHVDKSKKHYHKIIGGMRSRYFGIKPHLSKTPIFNFKRDTVYVSPHYLYPFRKNLEDIGHLVLLHYKFLPGDIEKYTERVTEKNMTSGSVQYTAYMEKIADTEKTEFYSPGISEKYENSQSLIKYGIIQKLDLS
jgi:hypothetical protein